MGRLSGKLRWDAYMECLGAPEVRVRVGLGLVLTLAVTLTQTLTLIPILTLKISFPPKVGREQEICSIWGHELL